ncbi:DSBA oxidoreductase [Rugosibacter aromaticivorans]|uniref:DSBA oxidoreductase n=1 Tax=Rugosibacter aromaticivorans TaxID=1565605 RepID=A0A0C5J935_9PROT|nr:DHA2 family efflux MFS transporter permease subunit [Rugosibacter aromaticivorans]AJP48144.1 DSBA oxidoreductase [Rugosibacter aromaticivorans]TBR15451.1 MAG: DHA2 family efflux MFS transporter permease subunit [Rugosibacter sp.]
MNSATTAGAAVRPLNRGMITLSLMLATVMQTLDSTIANVALPHIQGSLSASQDQITWVLTSYIVATAIATPLAGWLSDRFGQKYVLISSVAGFVLSSMMCGLSTSLTQLVFARLLQGAFGATLIPLSQVILMEINPKEKQGAAMAMWGMGVMIGPILGPTLGGWLTENYDWRWVFFVNIPIGVVALYGMWRYIRHVPGIRRTRFDMFGFATLSIALGALQMLLDRGEQNDWFASLETWIEAILFALMSVYFIVHTLLRPAGKSFFDYRLLKNRNYFSGLVFIFIVGIVLLTPRALIPSFLQNMLNYEVMTAGFLTAPTGFGTMISMVIVGRLVGRVDVRFLLLSGFSITAFSLWQMSRYTLVVSQSDIVWPGVIQGIGIGLTFVPLSVATFATLAPEMRAEGTAIYSLMRNIGNSIGISLMQTLLVRNTQIMHASLAGSVNYANPVFHDPAIATFYNPATPAGLLALNAEITRQAAMIAYINDFWLMCLMALLVIPFLFLLRPMSKHAPANVEHVVME